MFLCFDACTDVIADSQTKFKTYKNILTERNDTVNKKCIWGESPSPLQYLFYWHLFHSQQQCSFTPDHNINTIMF